METCLRCSVSPGQFTGEYAVSASQSNGELFSLFVDEELVDTESREHPGEGWLRVAILESRGNDVLIMLPAPSLEGGQFVTVPSNQLSSRRMHTSSK